MDASIYEMAREVPSAKSVQSNKTSICSRTSSILSCSICLSKILDPASLTCGHKFCEDCLQKYWDYTDRPVFIICPLCRANVFKVDFSQKKVSSTDDFRNSFGNYLATITETDDIPCPSVTCFKMTILLPAVYYLLKWLGLPIMELFTSIYRH